MYSGLLFWNELMPRIRTVVRPPGEPLFAAFAVAFWLLGLSQALLALADVPVEERSWLYVLRLAAFLVILAGILRKNRR